MASASRLLPSPSSPARPDAAAALDSSVERGLGRGVVPLSPQLLQLGDLLGAHPAVLDLEDLDLVVLVDLVAVHADHGLRTGVDPGLGTGGGLLDAQLRDALVDRLRHTAVLGDLGDVRTGLLARAGGSATRRSTTRPTGRSAGWCPDSCCSSSWVLRAMRAEKSVGSASASSRALVCSDWVWPCVAAIASIQVRATLLNASWAVSDQPEVCEWVRNDMRFGVFRTEFADQFAPQQPARAQLGDLHEEVHADAPEERQPRRELVDVQAGVQTGLEVLHTVGQRVAPAPGRPSRRPPGCGSRRSRCC